MSGRKTTFSVEEIEADGTRDYSAAVSAADELRNHPAESALAQFPSEKRTATAGHVGTMTLKETSRTAAIRGGEPRELSSSREPGQEDKFSAHLLGFSVEASKSYAESLRHVQQATLRREPMAERILRADVAGRIIPALRKMCEAVVEPKGAMIMSRIFKTIEHAAAVSPNSPFTRLLLALHDSLAFNNQWISYSHDQYTAAADTLAQLVRKPFINDSQANRAIVELEMIGFNTVPFAFPLPEGSVA